MKVLLSFALCCLIVFLSCTDRDDNLEGVQIRLENTTNATFKEVVVDTLSFADVRPEDLAFYQRYLGGQLPSEVVLISDSTEVTVFANSLLQIDSTKLNLFTYRIKGLVNGAKAEVEIVRD